MKLNFNANLIANVYSQGRNLFLRICDLYIFKTVELYNTLLDNKIICPLERFCLLLLQRKYNRGQTIASKRFKASRLPFCAFLCNVELRGAEASD